MNMLLVGDAYDISTTVPYLNVIFNVVPQTIFVLKESVVSNIYDTTNGNIRIVDNISDVPKDIEKVYLIYNSAMDISLFEKISYMFTCEVEIYIGLNDDIAPSIRDFVSFNSQYRIKQLDAALFCERIKRTNYKKDDLRNFPIICVCGIGQYSQKVFCEYGIMNFFLKNQIPVFNLSKDVFDIQSKTNGTDLISKQKQIASIFHKASCDSQGLILVSTDVERLDGAVKENIFFAIMMELFPPNYLVVCAPNRDIKPEEIQNLLKYRYNVLCDSIFVSDYCTNDYNDDTETFIYLPSKDNKCCSQSDYPLYGTHNIDELYEHICQKITYPNKVYII